MVNVLQSMILTDKGRMVLTPTYWVYKLYVPFQDAQVLPLKFDAGTYTLGGVSLPRVDAIAARGKDGKVWLALTNLDPSNSAEISTSAAGANAATATGEVLVADKVDAINTFDAPSQVMPRSVSVKAENGRLVLHLPPHSVTVVSLGS
jgi:alpha-N-arabinofuranosidase